MWLIEALRPKRFVELGTHTGVSYCAACEIVKACNLATQCYAVDTWKGDEHAGFYGEEIFVELDAYHASRYSGFSRLVRSTFDDALRHFEDGSIDLLHIDGMHTYEAVKHDFESWRRKLTASAIILFHDTNVRERGFGVFRFWAEVSMEQVSFEFLHGHGLGVLALGGVPSGDVGSLFAASATEEESAAVRQAFAHLGRACAQHVDARARANIARSRTSAHTLLQHFRAAQGVGLEQAYLTLVEQLKAATIVLELAHYHMIGERLVAEGLNVLAVEACTLGLERFPGNPALRVIRAEAQLGRGCKDQALADLKGNSGGKFGPKRVEWLQAAATDNRD